MWTQEVGTQLRMEYEVLELGYADESDLDTSGWNMSFSTAYQQGTSTAGSTSVSINEKKKGELVVGTGTTGSSKKITPYVSIRPGYVGTSVKIKIGRITLE